MQHQFQPMACQPDFSKGFSQFSAHGIWIFFVIWHNGKGSDTNPTALSHPKARRGDTGRAHIAHRTFVVQGFRIVLYTVYNIIGNQFGRNSRGHPRSRG